MSPMVKLAGYLTKSQQSLTKLLDSLDELFHQGLKEFTESHIPPALEAYKVQCTPKS